MKNYLARLRANAPTWQFVYWWVFRAVMIYGIIDSAFFRKDVQQVLQMSANLVGMFIWEIAQATSEKSLLRYIPSYCQVLAVPGFFLASFGGAYLNFYYTIPIYDQIFHFVGGGAGAWFGYEILTAIQKRDKVRCHLPFVLLAAFGFSFIFGNGWELFEFTFDQIAGGDSQHWSRALAEQAIREAAAKGFTIGMPNIIPELDPTRYALMDTMEDIVFNTLGGVAVYIFLRVNPYHHKGKNNVNAMFKDNTVNKEKKKVKAHK